jgi:hypothetical protein
MAYKKIASLNEMASIREIIVKGKCSCRSTRNHKTLFFHLVCCKIHESSMMQAMQNHSYENVRVFRFCDDDFGPSHMIRSKQKKNCIDPIFFWLGDCASRTVQEQPTAT